MLRKARQVSIAAARAAPPPLSAADERLIALFHELDEDGNGTLSVQELGKALQTNQEFAKLMGVASEAGRPVNALAAGLIAQNLRRIFDEENGDSDGLVSPEEFCAVVRKLAPASYGANAPASASVAASTKDARPPSLEAQSSASASAATKESRTPKRSFFSSSGKKNAAAEAAEARLSALQRMLREEVVGGLEGVLERSRDALDDAARVATYHEGVCDVLSACKRLLDIESAPAESGPAEPGSAEADALELLALRREIAETKIRLAESESSRAGVERELSLVKSPPSAKGRKSKR